MTPTPINPTKIRPGDRVTFYEAEVVQAFDIVVDIKWPNGRQERIYSDGIASVTPAPREFKKGDRVTWGTGDADRGDA